jgi:PAS domain S-box-containing protein
MPYRTSVTSILHAIQRAQQGFLSEEGTAQAFRDLLADLLHLTASGVGFLAELHTGDQETQRLELKAIARMEDSSEGARPIHNRMSEGLQLNPLGTLLDEVISGEGPVIHNELRGKGRELGLPEDHIPIQSFLGLPIRQGGELIGIVGLGNRVAGYQTDVMPALRSLLHTVATLVTGLRDRRARDSAIEELRISEAHLAHAQEIGQVGSWRYFPDSHELVWSDEVYRIFGVTPESFVPTWKSFTEFVVPEDRAVVQAGLENALQGTAERYELEHRIVLRETGEHRHLLELARHECDATGRVIRLEGVVRDITTERVAQERLRRQSELQGSVARGAAAMATAPSQEAFDKALRGTFHELALILSLHQVRLFEVSPDERSAHLVLSWPTPSGAAPVVHLKRRDATWNAWLDDFRGLSYTAHDDIRALPAPGEPFAQALVAQGARSLLSIPTISDTGRPSGFVDFVDFEHAHTWLEEEITALRLFAEIIGSLITQRRASTGMREALGRLNAIAQHVPGVIYQYRLRPDGSSHFPYASEGIYDIYGVHPAQVEDDASPVFGVIHPDDLEAVGKSIQHSAQTLTVWSVVYRVRHPSGETLWLEGQASPQRQEDASILWHGHTRDITEQKKTQAQQDAMKAQLDQMQKIESLGRLAGGVAHDFNNMLAVILGHADAVLDEMGEEHPLAPSMKAILRAADRSAGITKQLLGFARRQPATPKLIDLNEEITGILEMLRRLIGENIKIRWQPAAQQTRIKIDPNQLDQVLTNLCLNARDAIGEHGTITISTQRVELDEVFCKKHPTAQPGIYACMSVRDDGHGMPAEVASQVFEPFFTTKPVGAGTGLGLSTVHGIVSQNRGALDLSSEPSKGTEFHVYLPEQVISGSPHAAALHAEHAHASGRTPSSEFATILLVEDDADVSATARSILEHAGHTVVTAASPQEAIDQVLRCEQPVDLLLTDIVMPEMNGKELAEFIQTKHPSVRTLFMSGYTDDVIFQGGLVEENIHFVQKPFTGTQLREAVLAALPNA